MENLPSNTATPSSNTSWGFLKYIFGASSNKVAAPHASQSLAPRPKKDTRPSMQDRDMVRFAVVLSTPRQLAKGYTLFSTPSGTSGVCLSRVAQLEKGKMYRTESQLAISRSGSNEVIVGGLAGQARVYPVADISSDSRGDCHLRAFFPRGAAQVALEALSQQSFRGGLLLRDGEHSESAVPPFTVFDIAQLPAGQWYRVLHTRHHLRVQRVDEKEFYICFDYVASKNVVETQNPQVVPLSVKNTTTSNNNNNSAHSNNNSVNNSTNNSSLNGKKNNGSALRKRARPSAAFEVLDALDHDAPASEISFSASEISISASDLAPAPPPAPAPPSTGPPRKRMRKLAWEPLPLSIAPSTIWSSRIEILPKSTETEIAEIFALSPRRATATRAPRSALTHALPLPRLISAGVLLTHLPLSVSEINSQVTSLFPNSISAEFTQILIAVAPTQDEEVCLHTSARSEQCSHAEDVMRSLLLIPRVRERLIVYQTHVLYREIEVEILKRTFIVREACREVRTCDPLQTLLGVMCAVGGVLNENVKRGVRVTALRSVADVKGKNANLLDVIVKVLKDSDREAVLSIKKKNLNVKEARGVPMEVVDAECKEMRRRVEEMSAELEYLPAWVREEEGRVRRAVENVEKEVCEMKAEFADLVQWFGEDDVKAASPDTFFGLLDDFAEALYKYTILPPGKK